jgi:pimeloyl-ACP methyl ester carboxylesterase
MSKLPEAVRTGFQQLTEETSLALVAQIQTQALATPLQTQPIETAYIRQGQGHPPFLLLNGFDSSILEFRRLLPLLTPHRETWAIDLLGFGFTDRPPDLTFSPASIKTHLYAFWQQLIQQPVILIGASMGGTAAIDFTLTHPEAVHQLVLLDSAGINNGPTIGKYLFHPLDQWAVEFLRRPGVRHKISRSAYFNPDRYVTADADLCASLHLQMPHWDQALKSFTRSGGYASMRSQLKTLQQPTLILWGRQDKILGTQDAAVFAQEIPHSQRVWIEESGHVPHLEQAQAVADQILDFIAQTTPQPATTHS